MDLKTYRPALRDVILATWPSTRIGHSVQLREALGVEERDSYGFADLVRAVIDFANGETSPSLETRIAQSPSEPDQYLVWDAAADIDAVERVDLATARTVAENFIQWERRFAMAMLAAAAVGERALIKWIRDQVNNGRRSGVVFSPRLKISSGAVKVEYAIEAGEPCAIGWVMFASALIAQETTDGRTQVGRCQLESCGHFFLMTRTGKAGRPRASYCTDAHRQKQHESNAAERQRRARAARKATKALPRRPR